MINWETIKSLYNDKPTLLEWLKKVEAALSGATLTSVSVNTISVGVITLTFEFDDGTSITTPNINLPQGAQGVSITGAAIVAGKLIITLSNGTTIDAGNTGAVLGFEIDNSQHLIVKYQDGTTQDLGAIFTGNVNITGNLSVGGNISPLENIIDISSHKRFQEWAGELETIAGVEFTYHRASLSGTHLMFVLAGSIEDGATISDATRFCYFPLPDWIGGKIIPVFSGAFIERKSVKLYDNQWGTPVDMEVVTHKTQSGISITKVGNQTISGSKKYFRMQFDLLIDAQ